MYKLRVVQSGKQYDYEPGSKPSGNLAGAEHIY